MALFDMPRDGYQPFTRQSFAPLQQPGQFSDSFQGKPSSAAPPSDTKPSIPGSGGDGPQPARPGMQPTQPNYGGPAGQGYQTFAQMQAAGVPRPAPPTPPMGYPAGGFGAPGGSPVGDALNNAVLGGLNNPSAFNSDEVMRAFQRLSGGIDDQYALQTQKTNEQMAGRGLYDSTEAAGRLHDLNVGQRSAKTNLADSLLTQQAQTYGQDRNSAIMAALGLTGQQNQYALGQNSNLINILQALGAAGFLGDPSQIAGLFGQG